MARGPGARRASRAGRPRIWGLPRARTSHRRPRDRADRSSQTSDLPRIGEDRTGRGRHRRSPNSRASSACRTCNGCPRCKRCGPCCKGRRRPRRSAPSCTRDCAGPPTGGYAHLNQITLIRWDQGRLGELRGAWQELADQFPQVWFSRVGSRSPMREPGREDDARRWLRSLLGGLAEWLWYGNLLPALALGACATALLQDSWAAESVHRLVLRRSGRSSPVRPTRSCASDRCAVRDPGGDFDVPVGGGRGPFHPGDRRQHASEASRCAHSTRVRSHAHPAWA